MQLSINKEEAGNSDTWIKSLEIHKPTPERDDRDPMENGKREVRRTSPLHVHERISVHIRAEPETGDREP